MKRLVPIAVGALLLGMQATAQAETVDGSDYLAKDLLSPCQEADNDARWGEAAETECEQYIMGFVHAMAHSGAKAAACPPKLNTADEVRWAFMRWVHGDFKNRRGMSAPKALQAALKESFPCK